MVFEQALRLVSQSPENFAYHLIIFLCLQISFGLSLWLWRKSPDDKLAARLTIASALLLIVRVIWTFVLVKYSEDRIALAPVERATSLVAIAYLTWAMAPAWDEIANLRIFGLFLVTVGAGVGLYFAIPDWLNRYGIEAYADTAQAPAWALIGIILCIGSTFTLLLMRPFDWILRIGVIFPLAGALVLHFFAVNPQQFTPVELGAEITTGIVPVWDRFAWLISLPLLASISYRRVMSYLLDQTGLSGEGRTKLATMLEQSVNLLESEEMLDRIDNASELFDGMYGTQFVGLASISNEDVSFADMAMRQKNLEGDRFEEPRRWMLNLADWPFLLHALNQHEATQISPYDTDSNRKIYEFHQELHLRFITPILAIPLRRDAQRIGLILLGANPQRVRWEKEDREILTRLGDHIARAFLDHERLARFQFAEKGLGIVDDLEITAKIDALEEENQLLTGRLTESIKRTHQLERDLRVSRKVADDLKKREAQAPPEAEALKQEVSILRDALMEAEISLSNKSLELPAAEQLPDLDKYSQTITQYSGELELAQQRIDQLEFQLNRILTNTQSSNVGSPLEEIRGPLAMIKSYIDLLLIDNTGFLSVKQIDLLQRVQTSSNRVSHLLDELDAMFEDQLSAVILSEVDTVFSQSISSLKEKVEDRQVKLDLELDEHFPQIPIGSATLVHIFTTMMGNVADNTRNEGTMKVSLTMDEVLADKEFESLNTSRFLNLAVGTNHYDQNQKRGAKDLTDLENTKGIYSIIKAHAGRIWAHKDEKAGTYQITVLLPVIELERPEKKPSSLNQDEESQERLQIGK